MDEQELIAWGYSQAEVSDWKAAALHVERPGWEAAGAGSAAQG